MIGCEHRRQAAVHAEPDDAGPAGAVRPASQRAPHPVAERLAQSRIKKDTSTGRPVEQPGPAEILHTQASPLGGAGHALRRALVMATPGGPAPVGGLR